MWKHLRHVYPALTVRELARIEKTTLLLINGFPCDGPYMTYARLLWNEADAVRPRPYATPVLLWVFPMFPRPLAAVAWRADSAAADHDALALRSSLRSRSQ